MANVITDSNFQEIIQANNVVMIDFWAEWCGPCKRVSPIVDELSEEYEGKAFIGKVDVEENPETPEKYLIRNIPTILFFKDGELADKAIGALPKSDLENKLKALL